MGRAALATLVALLAVSLHASAKETFLPDPPQADRDFYEKRVAPWIEANCAQCHRGGGGALRLCEEEPGLSERMRRHTDYARLLPFINRKAPWESRLLLKVLEPGEGGDPHVGGAFVAPDEPDYDALLDFVSGATLTNLPPEVFFEKNELRGKPGETIAVDGRGSYDRDRDDMDGLTYFWELYARPAESRVIIQDRRASRLEFKPDTGGSYVFRLRVSDGKVWSAPRAVTVEVFQHIKLEKTKPGGVTGLAKAEIRNLARLRRLYLDVLGRPPTPPEAIAEERKGIKFLVKNIMLRAEGGRAWVEEVAIRFGLFDDYRPVSDDARDLALKIPAEGTPPHVVEGVLARDPSFLRRHPPGRPLAKAIGELLLGRPPSDAEVLAAIELADGTPADIPGIGTVPDSRAWLVKVLDSRAFRRAAVLRRLGRFVDSGDARKRVERALGAINEGQQEWTAFLSDLLRSERYLNRKRLRPKGTVTFLRSLFVDLLERKPTDRELAALVRAVKTLPGKSAAFAAVVRVLIDSGETPLPLLVEIRDGPAWITDRFLRYLGRKPRTQEMKLYGQALLHPGGGPELVVHALLTSPEYMCR